MGSHEAHYKQAAKTLGMTLDDLYPRTAELPHVLNYLWGYFAELAGGRTSGFGPNPITFSDMLAWCRLNAIKLHPWEVKAIRDVDRLYLEECHNARSSRVKSGNQEQPGNPSEQ